MKQKYLMRLFSFSIAISCFAVSAMAQEVEKSEVKKEIDTLRQASKTRIGFGTQNSRIVTSAITTVNGEDLEKNFNTNLGRALFGKLSGLSIAQGGSEPGAGTPSFTLRGRNTFGEGSNDPLIIIDGLIGGGSANGSIFSQLVPEEIESVNLLKDAAATSIYGARGANGVLLITTKTGVLGPLKINFSTRQGLNQAAYLPKFLNSGDYAALFNEGLQNDGQPVKYTDEDIAAYRSGSDPVFHPNVNWYDEVLRKAAPVSSYNLNFNGGDNTVRYFVLLNAIGNQGLYKNFGDDFPESTNSSYNRYNFRSNIDINISKNLSASFKLAGSVEKKANPFDYTTDSQFNLLASLPPNAFPAINPDGTYGGSTIYANPLANLQNTGFYESNSRTLQSALSLTQKLDFLTKGLSMAGTVSINNFFVAGTQKTKTYSRYAIISKNATTGQPVYGPVIGQTTTLSAAEVTRNQYRNFQIQGFVNYHRVFDKSDISAMAMIQTDNESLTNLTPDVGSGSDPYKHNSVNGRMTYVYDQKYIAEFSMGYMGSERYAPGRRYGFFPAGSVGWIISNESFFKNKIVDFLKVRASYGLTGNDNTVLNSSYGRYPFFQSYNFDGSEGQLANPFFTWEKEKSLNLGLDAKLFKNFNLNIDVFNRERYDILVTPNGTVPQFLGASLPLLNQGKTRSRGLETSVGYQSPNKSKFQYFASANFSVFKNTIVFDAQSLQLNSGLVNAGGLNGQPRRLQAIGFFSQEEITARNSNPLLFPAPLDAVLRAGDLKYRDVGGPNGVPDGIIDDNDLVAVGNPAIPRIAMGLTTGFKFMNIDLNLVFQAVTNVSAYLGGNYFQAFQNNGQVGLIALGRWTPETAQTATYPRLSANNNLNNYRNSSFWVRDASFIKLRSVELGYQIPSGILSKVKLNQARLFIQGTNLFSLDRIEYGDPESLTGYPVLRTFVLGAKIGL